MQLIGENIHVISKSVKEALLKRDEKYISELVKKQNNMDFIDLNVGPARGDFSGSLILLTEIVQKYNQNIGISFDTTNIEEIISAINICKNTSNTFINSISAENENFEKISSLALKNNCNLIALTMSKKTGIPKSSEGRLELAFEMYDKFMEKNFNMQKIYFDPLVLPLTADQSQAMEAINTIKMLKESFDPPIKTIIGLSNVSNGCPKDLRSLINRVFAVLCHGAGLDAAIIDAFDEELVRILYMLEKNNPQSKKDELLINLSQMISNFEDIESLKYNVEEKEENLIIKTAKIILNKEIYSDSFTQI